MKKINNVKELRDEFKINDYIDYSQHKELISFIVPTDVFDEYTFTNSTEIIVVVEKNWLFELMTKDGISDPQEYLMNEYTSKDSWYWCNNAILEDKIVTLELN